MIYTKNILETVGDRSQSMVKGILGHHDYISESTNATASVGYRKSSVHHNFLRFRAYMSLCSILNSTSGCYRGIVKSISESKNIKK